MTVVMLMFWFISIDAVMWTEQLNVNNILLSLPSGCA
jgi:hypothetical protein